MKKSWLFVLLGILLLGWVASLLLQEPSESKGVASLIVESGPVIVEPAEPVVVEEVDDEVTVPAIDETPIEEVATADEVEETRKAPVRIGISDGKLTHETQDGKPIELAEPKGSGAYAVITGLVAFGVETEENRLHPDRAILSGEEHDKLAAAWTEAGVELVPLEPIALRRPDWAMMEIVRSADLGAHWQAGSVHLDRSTFSINRGDIENQAPGSTGQAFWLCMIERSRTCAVDASGWRNGVPDHEGDLGSLEVPETGVAHYQFHWASQDYSVLMSVEERLREELAEE